MSRSTDLWELQQSERRALYDYARAKLKFSQYVPSRRQNALGTKNRHAEIVRYVERHFNERLD
jgi:hypothetical protein